MDVEYMMKMCEMAEIMFKNHQELCPHDMEWVLQESGNSSISKTKYRCKVCGKEQVVINDQGDV